MPIPSRIPLDKLLSPKTSLAFRDGPEQAPGESFFRLVDKYRNSEPVEPIQVVPKGSQYVILDGVHRAMAAFAAGRMDIEAVVLSSAVVGAPLGLSVPLDRVMFPFDLRSPGH
jgi:hypothetical protein